MWAACFTWRCRATGGWDRGADAAKNLVPLAHVEHGWAMGNSLTVFGDDVGGAVQLPLDQIESYFRCRSGWPSRRINRRRISRPAARTKSPLSICGSWWRRPSPRTRQPGKRFIGLREVRAGAHPGGEKPRTVALSPDGGTLYVSNRLDDTVSVVDTARGVVTGTISLGGPATLTAERRGERLFYSSKYAWGGQFGCANCHLDSTFDGLQWDLEPDGFGIDIVDNRQLEEIGGTAPYKWNGGNPDLPTECGPRTERYFFRSQGIRGDDLQDLAQYVTSIPLRPNRYRSPDGELTPRRSAERRSSRGLPRRTARPFRR